MYMVPKTTQTTAFFVVLAVVLTYAASVVVGGVAVPVAILLGVGVVLPTIINQWPASENTT